MPSYNIKRDFPQNGRPQRKGGSIEMSERQARHLLIAGFIEPKKEEPKKPATKDTRKQDKGEK